jgi:hypothetical protein
MRNATMTDAETYVANRVAELAAPGSFTARMFAQTTLVESVLAAFGRLFNGREHEAGMLVGRLYAERFPQR